MRLGALDIEVVSDGAFRLDGGAMFGVVPRVMWQEVKAPDERNRIRMATNCLLVRRGSELLLIDTGIGNRHDERFRDMYGLEPGSSRLPEAIARAGYDLGDVTHVLLTHLHFDHAGWNARPAAGGRDGRLVPTFPRARYWLARGEVEHARHPNERDRATYDPLNWEPLFEAGAVELFDDRATPIAGVEAVRVPGHNADMCIVLLDGGEAPGDPGDPGDHRAVFWADLVPTTAHVAYPWIMSYDLYPMQTLENKKLWLPRAAAGGWLAIFEHDCDQPLGRLVEERPGRYRAVPVAVPAAAGARET
jgi:glyoxylase-like metal-dependent hydrolase (beta-lactamase superfamily II)